MLKRPLRKATRARVVRTALLLSVWQREVKIEGVHLQGVLRQCAGSTPPKYLTDIQPSNIWGVYNPKIFDGCMSVKYLTHAHASVIWGVYTPKIFDGCMPRLVPELSGLPCCFQCGREHLQGVLRQCAAVTRCLEVGDMGEGSVTAPGVKHG